MENQKRKGSAGTIALVVLLLIVAIVSIILATYAWAKYTTTKTGKAEVAVAKWDVTFNGTLTNHQYQHVKTGKLAPGTTGQFAMNFSSENTEVAYDYTILIKNLANKPTNLKFYTDSNYTNEISISGTSAQFFNGSVTLDSNGKATIFSDTTNQGQPIIYWKWAYETDTPRTQVPTNSPATEANMKQAMVDLANAVRVNNGEATVDASTFASAQAALTDALRPTKPNPQGGEDLARTPATAIQVNDAIDTAEGKTSYSEGTEDNPSTTEVEEATAGLVMSFDVDFTATQKTPVKQ